jgi:D-alanine-D-alanine ligase
MKKAVAVIFGGRSAEHDVSIITGHIPIIQALESSSDYEPVPVYITPDGGWYSDPAMNSLDYFKKPGFLEELKTKKQLQFSFENGFNLIWPGLRPKVRSIDIVFPAMHGTYGEDGTLMGMLRLSGVPFVGCDLEASAVAMDKVLTKQATIPLGVPSVPYVWFTSSDWQNDPAAQTKRINKELKYPLFIKPVHLGSTIAITKVQSPGKLTDAIEVALHYDDKVIVEESVENLIEVTLPIIGNDELTLAQIEQPVAKFFDFEAKYLQGGKKGSSGGANSGYSHIPALISKDLAKKVNEYGIATYRGIGASGTARIDFLIDSKTNKVYMNEVNTLPGSLYVHNWKQSGLSALELVTKLIDLAVERHKTREKLVFTFHSDILKVVGGAKIQP